MNILGVITARGGSKGLKEKNVKLFLGQPLISHTINCAHSVKDKFYKIIVSTDDPKIAKISEQFGANVPFLRPKNISRDKSSSLSVIKHAVDFIENKDRVNIDWIMTLQPTSPLRNPNDILKSIDIAKNNNCDTVVSVFNSNKFHPSKVKKMSKHGFLKPYYSSLNEPQRRQEFETNAYLRNGAIYLTKRSLLLNDKFYGDKICAHVMPLERSVDIDNLFDFELAEHLYVKLNKGNQ